MMEKIVSNWYDVQAVAEKYVFPPETRPGSIHVPISASIPVIDLSQEAEKGTVQKVLKAAQEFGFFQVHVINHGIPENVMNGTMSVLKEFFLLQPEANLDLYSEGSGMKDVRFTKNGVTCAAENVHIWRDGLKHPCPLEKWQHIWPQTPHRYQEIVGSCLVEVKKLGSRMLRLISEGLGLHGEYLEGDYSQNLNLSTSFYPPCPQPDLTLRIHKHADPNIITLLLQDGIYGLQMLKDDTWIGVDPNPNAIMVDIASQFQVISNDKLKSAEHRAVTNSSEARTSAAFFITASEESIIEPAKALIDELHPPIYKPFKSKDFHPKFYATYGDSQATLDFFKA